MLLATNQGVLAVGTGLSASSELASGTRQVAFSAGSAVLRPFARLEMPAAESPDPFFAVFSNTWRSVNS
jgi:hypothetical protein